MAKQTKLKKLVEGIFDEAPQINKYEVTEGVRSYGIVGKQLYGGSNIMEIAKQLSHIAEQAHTHILGEQDDWFDKVTVNRNMKELTTLSKSFGKFAKEAHGLQERMSALYEDMGHIVGRYYEVDDEDHEPGHEEEGGSIEEGDYEGHYSVVRL